MRVWLVCDWWMTLYRMSVDVRTTETILLLVHVQLSEVMWCQELPSLQAHVADEVASVMRGSYSCNTPASIVAARVLQSESLLCPRR